MYKTWKYNRGNTYISYRREHARIDKFYVLPEYQGMNIGSTVIKLIEDLLHMVKVWTLDIIQESPRNHHFYEKNGYKLASEDNEERYYCKILDENIYDSDWNAPYI